MYTKQHLISLLGYIGIGFIGWSISHGFFSGTRSFIMAMLGILLFIISEYLQWWEKNYFHLIVWWLIFSIAVGMVSGWLQHFLDSPIRSLWIIPVWWFISSAIFPYKEELTHYNYKKSLIVAWLISIVLCIVLRWLIWILPSDAFLVIDHH